MKLPTAGLWLALGSCAGLWGQCCQIAIPQEQHHDVNKVYTVISNYRNNASDGKRAAEQFCKDAVGAAWLSYEEWLEDFFARGTLRRDEVEEAARLWHTVAESSGWISRSLDRSTPEGFLLNIRVWHAQAFLEDLIRDAKELLQMTDVSGKIFDEQPRLLFLVMGYKKGLTYFGKLVGLLNGSERQEQLGDPNPEMLKHATVKEYLRGLVAPATAIYAELVDHLTRLVDSFRLVTDKAVFRYIYTCLLKDWEFYLSFDVYFDRSFVVKSAANFKTLIPALALGLVRKIDVADESDGQLNRGPAVNLHKMRTWKNYNIDENWLKDPRVTISFAKGLDDVLVFCAILRTRPTLIERELVEIMYLRSLVMTAISELYPRNRRRLIIMSLTLLVYYEIVRELLAEEHFSKLMFKVDSKPSCIVSAGLKSGREPEE